jgi:hypothetical protein
MPDCLDSVDWGSLTHAYGTAEDVPELLRALRSDDEEERREAMYELCGNIYHQGTRYEATAHAVPFLLELVADPATPDRTEVMHLLTSMAIGSGYQHAADGYPIAEIRERVASVPETVRRDWTRLMREWMTAPRGEGRPQPMPLSRAEHGLLEEAHELAAYDAVGEGVAVLAGLASDPDLDLAEQAVHSLAWFPERAEASLPVLAALAADGKAPPELVSAALVALGHVAPKGIHDYDSLLRTHLSGDEPSLRWSAAVGWALAAGADAPDEAIEELTTWAARYGDGSPNTVWDISGPDLALKLLDRVAPPVARRIRVELTESELAKEPKSNWHNHFNVVLDRAFPSMDAGHGLAFAELAPAQRAVVTWLAERPGVFGSAGPDGPLRQHGLPTTHEQLIAYAADV